MLLFEHYPVISAGLVPVECYNIYFRMQSFVKPTKYFHHYKRNRLI